MKQKKLASWSFSSLSSSSSGKTPSSSSSNSVNRVGPPVVRPPLTLELATPPHDSKKSSRLTCNHNLKKLTLGVFAILRFCVHVVTIKRHNSYVSPARCRYWCWSATLLKLVPSQHRLWSSHRYPRLVRCSSSSDNSEPCSTIHRGNSSSEQDAPDSTRDFVRGRLSLRLNLALCVVLPMVLKHYSIHLKSMRVILQNKKEI